MTPAQHSKPDHRAAINRANARHSTGPRTPAGKQRSSLNALRHGLTSRTVVLPSEDLAAYRRLTQEFFDEYQPQGPTEKQLVQELAATAWRLNRIPALEADLLARATAPPTPESAIAFDIVEPSAPSPTWACIPIVSPGNLTKLSTNYAGFRPNAETINSAN
jgi:hypothetical protein